MVMTFANGDKIYHVELNSIVDAHNENGVLKGLEVTAQSTPSLNVDVSAGQCHVDNETYEKTSVTTVLMASGHSTHPRIDMVYYDTALDLVLRTLGTAAATPIPPDIPADDIILALVSVPANDTTIESSQIIDERIFIRPIGLYYAASDTLLDSSDAEEYHGVTSYVKLKELTIPDDIFSNDSTLRIKFDLKSDNGATPVYGRIYRNGVAVGTERSTTNSSYQSYSEDISGWSASDLIQLYSKTSSFGDDVYVRNFRVYGDIDVKSVYNW